MNKFVKIIALVLGITFASWANAQRTPVPVMDFINVPAPTSGTKVLTTEQVRQAIMSACTLREWTSKDVEPGVIEATYFKNFKHTVVARIRYSATQYSVTYVSSENMKYSEDAHDLPNPTYKHAREVQVSQFAGDPYTPYAVRHKGLIHPFYELWVRRLMKSIDNEFNRV